MCLGPGSQMVITQNEGHWEDGVQCLGGGGEVQRRAVQLCVCKPRDLPPHATIKDLPERRCQRSSVTQNGHHPPSRAAEEMEEPTTTVECQESVQKESRFGC